MSMSVQFNPLGASQTREEHSDNQEPGAVQGDDDAQQICFACGREIVEGRWFCRVPREAKRIVLCCPRCALRYFDTLGALPRMRMAQSMTFGNPDRTIPARRKGVQSC